MAKKIFQLTPSRRATDSEVFICSREEISTHALTEGDGEEKYMKDLIEAFQLTPSRRATSALLCPSMWQNTFQLTPSRRATANLDKFFF